MKLLPLDCRELTELVANWLSQEGNCKWLDFGNGVHSPSAVSLKVMTQRDLHVLRVFTPHDSDLPIGVVGLSNVDRRFKTAGSMWAVLGQKRYGGCHWIDGRPYDRLLYDLLATEHRELPDA